MKKIFFISLALFLAFAFFLYAQGKQNFTGIWQLDKTKSKLPQMGNFEYPDTKLNITQKDKDIKIETTTVRQSGERTTTMDLVIGGGETKVEASFGFGGRAGVGGGRGAGGPVPTTAVGKAEWSKDGTSLIISIKMTISTPNGTFSTESVSTYTLSKDGKILTENQKRTTQRGESEAVLVYNKAAK
jgi:hypothetical protein